jgi:L-2-hydroxyglutarate oxidase LhgO
LSAFDILVNNHFSKGFWSNLAKAKSTLTLAKSENTIEVIEKIQKEHEGYKVKKMRSADSSGLCLDNLYFVTKKQ